MSADRPLTLRKSSEPQGLTAPRPVLHLSGPKLRSALERLIGAAEVLGGVERFAEAVRLKSAVFQDRLAEGKAAAITRAEFDEIVPLMATVRRRIAPLLEPSRWSHTQAAIVALLDNAHDTTIADQRVTTFESALRTLVTYPLVGKVAPRAGAGDDGDAVASETIPTPSSAPQGGREGRQSTRFLRDLAAEILHNTLPEYYPLMSRWVWDNKANSGVVREIWHDPSSGDDVDHIVIDVPDGYEVHLVLREELSQFLADNGVFRDMLWHVDLLCAQIYGDYINAQGGAWLKTEFGSPSDPLEHSRRILGLDRVARGSRASVSGEWSVVSGSIGKDG